MSRPRTQCPFPRPGSTVRTPRRASAFTMVEMMVVVTIIAIMAVAVGFSLKGGGQGRALNNAQRSVLAMIQAARNGAQLNRTRARLIVYSDKNFVPASSNQAASVNSKILRYYGVIYAQSDNPNTPPLPGALGASYHIWSAPPEGGAYLPEGIYFVPSKASSYVTDLPTFSNPHTNAIDNSQGDYSVDGAPGVTTSYDVHKGVTTGEMQIDFPIAQSLEGTGDWYYFIEFAPDGFYYNSNGNNNILVGVAVTPDSNSISFRGTGEKPSLMFTGVQLRALGGAVAFRSPDDFTGTTH